MENIHKSHLTSWTQNWEKIWKEWKKLNAIEVLDIIGDSELEVNIQKLPAEEVSLLVSQEKSDSCSYLLLSNNNSFNVFVLDILISKKSYLNCIRKFLLLFTTHIFSPL